MTTYYACQRQNGDIRMVSGTGLCDADETELSWNQVGPTGPQGPQGPAGPQGLPGPSIQMLSGTFADQSISTDGITKVTLISIPFSVTTTGTLAITSLIDVIGNNANAQVQVTCELDIDGVPFFSAATYLTDYVATSTIIGNNAVGVTSTASDIASGNHTLTIKCIGGYTTGTLTAHSRGTSVIVQG